MQWKEIIEFLGGTTAISLTFGFLGKKAIEAYLAGRIEAYKNNLEKIAYEHTVRFKRLHTERAEIVKIIYEKLVFLDDTLCSTLRFLQRVDEPSLKDKVDKLSDQFNELREYFLPKRIFFEKKLCELIDKILESAKDVFYDITTLPVDPKGKPYKYDKELLRERHDFWEKARGIHKNEIYQLKTELENEFRTILGVNA